jgi:hypothetical protein
MIERGSAAADRLEGTIRARREAPKAEASPQAAPERPRTAPPVQASRNDASAAAAKLVEQMAARLAPPAPSRAERELMRALGGRR